MDVTKKNFSKALPIIKEILRRSTFIALDCEFSGLFLQSHLDRFDDSLDERYEKIRLAQSQFAVLQVGICSVVEVNKCGTIDYVLYPFNFYVFPTSWAPFKKSLLFDASTAKFLSKHGFDFNRCFHDGIPYLNKSETKLCRQLLDPQRSFDDLVKLGVFNESKLYNVLTRVAQFHGGINDGNSDGEAADVLKFSMDEVPSDCDEVLQKYIIRLLLEKHFNNELLIEFEGGGHDKDGVKQSLVCLVKRPSADGRQRPRHPAAVQDDFEAIVEYMRGFSQVFDLLTEEKKLFVGHNCLLDMTLISQHFDDPLPATYPQFKQRWLSNFPHSFDTKLISSKLRSSLPENLRYEQNHCGNLYKHLRSLPQLALNWPSIAVTVEPLFEKYSGGSGTAHEAGFDALMTAEIFLRICHLKLYSESLLPAADKLGLDGLRVRDYFNSIDDWVNTINVVGCATNVTYLDKVDQQVKPVELLLHSKQPLDLAEIHLELRKFGQLKTTKLNDRSLLLTVPLPNRAKEILRTWSVDNVSVVKYRPLVHRYGMGLLKAVAAGGLVALPLSCYYFLFRR